MINENLLKELGFGKEVERKNAGFCPFCSKPVTLEEFRDEISVREFNISGICQKCQDRTFGGEE